MASTDLLYLLWTGIWGSPSTHTWSRNRYWSTGWHITILLGGVVRIIRVFTVFHSTSCQHVTFSSFLFARKRTCFSCFFWPVSPWKSVLWLLFIVFVYFRWINEGETKKWCCFFEVVTMCCVENEWVTIG